LVHPFIEPACLLALQGTAISEIYLLNYLFPLGSFKQRFKYHVLQSVDTKCRKHGEKTNAYNTFLVGKPEGRKY
jgi:hypothetical protein